MSELKPHRIGFFVIQDGRSDFGLSILHRKIGDVVWFRGRTEFLNALPEKNLVLELLKMQKPHGVLLLQILCFNGLIDFGVQG
jgi:hypothetical protein